jgi:hypothetical protein
VGREPKEVGKSGSRARYTFSISSSVAPWRAAILIIESMLAARPFL